MTEQDWELLKNWIENNKEHKLSFIEKEAIKMALRRCNTLEDLLKTALDLLKKQS